MEVPIVEAWYALIIGVLFGTGVYLILRRSVARVLLGVMLLSQSVNLALFTAPGVSSQSPPIIPLASTVLPATTADPLPQALILTAIVIGFGMLAFLLVLTLRAFEEIGSDRMDDLTREQIDENT